MRLVLLMVFVVDVKIGSFARPSVVLFLLLLELVLSLFIHEDDVKSD